MPGTKTIEQSEFFPGTTPKQIYDAFLSGPKHTKMTGGKATAGTKVGDKFTAWDGYISGENLALNEDKSIVQSWQTGEWPEGAAASRLEWTFTEKDGGTEVNMVHSNVPASQAGNYEKGWFDFYWTPMKVYFA